MSRSLAANRGSLLSLKVLIWCGLSRCARQIRCTELLPIPTASAMAAAGQCVASRGGSLVVSSTTRSITVCDKGGMREGRVLSRRSPATPSRLNRSCQRQTHGLDLPVRRMRAAVPQPSAVARMIFARQTRFCGLFRSAATASRRARSAALTSTRIPSPILTTWGHEPPKGTFRQG
jgi:hypothetical protein